jgi:hypothetical protein
VDWNLVLMTSLSLFNGADDATAAVSIVIVAVYLGLMTSLLYVPGADGITVVVMYRNLVLRTSLLLVHVCTW